MWSVTGSLLEDPEVENDQLDFEMVLGPSHGHQTINPSPGDSSRSLCFSGATEEKEKDSEDEWKGFCVYANKTVLFGHDGLFWLANPAKSKRGRSIRALQNKVITPVKVNFLSPLVPLLKLFK